MDDDLASSYAGSECDVSDPDIFYDSGDEGSKQKSFQILKYEELHQEMDKIAGQVSAVIGLSRSVCKTLLHVFHWNKDSLMENGNKFRFYDTSDLSIYGIVLGDKESNLTMNTERRDVCNICDEISILRSLNCRHEFCTECWKNYLYHKIVTYGVSRIMCPAGKCKTIVPDETVIQLTVDSSVKQKFLKLAANGFVNNNRLMKFCPSKGCELASRVDTIGCLRINCGCGFSYCFECVEEWHEPISCDLLKVWLKQCEDDSETFNWINAYTKDCPKCKTAIEKNGGCNHMTCRSTSCSYEFCWVCMGDWKEHGYNGCNRFDPKKDDREKKAESSRAALERYLHFYNRYRNHENSLKLEHKLYETVDKKSLSLQHEQNVGLAETNFLRTAIDMLGNCRRTLKYTYAFGFYLAPEFHVTKIFEDNQQDLERSTEDLSDLLENQLSENSDFNEIRQKIQDKARYLEKRRNILLEHCQEGTEGREWMYNVNIVCGTICLD